MLFIAMMLAAALGFGRIDQRLVRAGVRHRHDRAPLLLIAEQLLGQQAGDVEAQILGVIRQGFGEFGKDHGSSFPLCHRRRGIEWKKGKGPRQSRG
jgi:hypothetical protein